MWFDGWRPVASIRPTTGINYEIYRITSDQVGAPITVRDDNGTTVWTWDIKDPFGYELPNQDPDANSVYFMLGLRFPGQWLDQETGLYHNGARDYSAKAGRYIQSDPLGLEAGWNTYAYVSNNPTTQVDPSGLIQLDSFTPTGKPVERCMGRVDGVYCAMMQRGTMKTDKNHKFDVYKHISGSENLKVNCHGFALGVEIWVEDPLPVYEDEYERVHSENEAELILYTKGSGPNRKPTHSSVVSNPVNFGKNGSYPLGPDPKFLHSGAQEYYRKK